MESQTDTRSRCAEGKVTKAKPLTGDTQTPPTAHGAQFWRQTIMNRPGPQPLAGGRQLAAVKAPFHPGVSPQDACPSDHKAWPGVRGSQVEGTL